MYNLKILEGVLNEIGFSPKSTYFNKNSIVKSFSKKYEDIFKRNNISIATMWIDKETNEVTSFFVRDNSYSSELIEYKDFYEENKYVFRKHKLLDLV